MWVGVWVGVYWDSAPAELHSCDDDVPHRQNDGRQEQRVVQVHAVAELIQSGIYDALRHRLGGGLQQRYTELHELQIPVCVKEEVRNNCGTNQG